MDKVVHFEIPAEDLERAKKFYSEIFDWKLEDMPNMDYVMVSTVEKDEQNMPKEVGAINGGIFKISASGKHPIVVINVKDIESYLLKVEKYGGMVLMEPQKIGDMGLYSRFVDTEGNIVGLWQNLSPVAREEGMVKFGCRELGGDCDYVAVGKTAQEVKNKIFEHAASAHPEKLVSMSEQDKQAMLKKMDEILMERA